MTRPAKISSARTAATTPPPAARRRPAPAVIIESQADIARGMRALRRRCVVVRAMHSLAGDPPLRRRPAGFEGLARIIVGQQLSVASAGAIWDRLATTVTPLSADALLACTDPQLQAAGLSRPKIRTLRAVSSAVATGTLAPDRLAAATDEEVHAALTAVTGIGPWTADIFMMFCLGRADAFAAGDLALQVAAQIAFGLEDRPNPDELLALAERWRPWRGVAARLMWAYYAEAKRQRSAIPV